MTFGAVLNVVLLLESTDLVKEWKHAQKCWPLNSNEHFYRF